MATTNLPPGIYRIVVAGGDAEPARLTRHGQHDVTILPPDADRNHDQEWQVLPRPDGNIIIERPSRIIPKSYLTFQGAPKKPEQHDRIVYHVSEFPPNEWHLAIAPGFRSLIRVAGSELGITISPLKIFPPILELGHEHQLGWVFERVGDE